MMKIKIIGIVLLIGFIGTCDHSDSKSEKQAPPSTVSKQNANYSANQYNQIFQKAKEYESKGYWETAAAAYEIIINYSKDSNLVSESRSRLQTVRAKIQENSQPRKSQLANIQLPNLNQGRSVKTAVQTGLSITSTEERQLERLTEEFMSSVGLSPTSNIPKPQRSNAGVPMPMIEKIYCPPIGTVGEPLFIKVICKNIGSSARQGGITISFPDKPDYITVLKSADQDAEIKLYPQGSKLYSGAKSAYIMSTYPMIETYKWTSIPSNESYTLTTILIPDRAGILRLYIRTALRGAGKNFYNFPSQGELDQQSYNVLEYPIYIKE